jgi:hypothetical protein
MENDPIKAREKSACLDIRVHPASSKRRIEYMPRGKLQVYVHSPAQEGRANREALKVIAEGLGLKRSQIELAAGNRSRDKTIKISGMDEETLHKRLENL